MKTHHRVRAMAAVDRRYHDRFEESKLLSPFCCFVFTFSCWYMCYRWKQINGNILRLYTIIKYQIYTIFWKYEKKIKQNFCVGATSISFAHLSAANGNMIWITDTLVSKEDEEVSRVLAHFISEWVCPIKKLLFHINKFFHFDLWLHRHMRNKSVVHIRWQMPPKRSNISTRWIRIFIQFLL